MNKYEVAGKYTNVPVKCWCSDDDVYTYCAPFCKAGHHTSKVTWCFIGHKTSNAKQKITICHVSTYRENENEKYNVLLKFEHQRSNEIFVCISGILVKC